MEQGTSIDITAVSGQRGPADHKRRQQILQAADEHFRLYGYRKTTLADIAKAINLSTPYLYKFFDSKQALGEAICSQCLSGALAEVEDLAAAANSPVDKLRRVFTGLEDRAWRFLNDEKKIHDLVLVSFEEHWGSLTRFREARFQMIRKIVI